MAHFASMCCSYLLNPKLFFYDGHDSQFDDRALDIIRRHNTQYFILKSGDYVHDHKNYNGPNTNLNKLFGNARINYMRHHETLKFSLPHINSVLVETCEVFTL